jgi:2,3-bisphosphoglycerate-dependent phosphoglycerate mutase
LQGLNKEETARECGEEQVQKWRKSVDIAPPSLTKEDSRYVGNEIKYRNLTEGEIPLTESLADTEKRVLEEWNEVIIPKLKANKKIIISAHGNTLRALVKHLDNMTSDGIANLNIPTGTPVIYELDEDLKPIRHYYLPLEGEIPKNHIEKYI